MKTLSKNAIYTICLTTDLVNQFCQNELIARFVAIGTGLAVRCLDENKVEDAQRVVLKAQVMLREQLAREGINDERVNAFLQHEEVQFALRVGLGVLNIDPAITGQEIVDFANSMREEMGIPKEEPLFTIPGVGQA